MAAGEVAQRVETLLTHDPAEPTLAQFIAGSKLRSVVVGSSKDPNAKITILLVAPDRRRVVFAVKVPTSDQAARAVEAERRVLAALSRLAPELSATVPRSIGTVEFHGRRGIVLTAVAGRPMMASYVRRRHTADARCVAGDFGAAARWLARLQRTTATHRAPVDMDAGVTARLQRQFGEDARIGDDIERLSAIHGCLALTTAPRTAVHGDFWFGNILVESGATSGVVDWEAAETEGEPVRDLVRFALGYALYLDWRTKRGRRVPGHPLLRAGGWGAGVEYALYGSGWFPELVRRFLQTGLARLGARPEYWREAALAGIAEVAALTDHPEFARSHLELFRRLTADRRSERWASRAEPVRA